MKKISKYIDCLGIVHIRRSPQPVKRYTTNLKSISLSRNELYYTSKPLQEILNMREELLSLLGLDRIENYIILDYAINFSAQTYYNLICSRANNKLIQQAKSCLQEDVNNMVSLIENVCKFSHSNILPQIDMRINFRNIELDNKLAIYSYVKNFGKTNYTYISPGLGSILIGPFFHSIWGNDYKHVLYSRFKENNTNIKILKNLGKNPYLIDDNIGSGFTTQELISLYNNRFLGTTAVEFDWFLYDIISRGLSKYVKFNYELYDNLILLNTRNHKFLDNAINILKNTPNKYLKFLKKNNFNHFLLNDLQISLKIGKNSAKKYLPKHLFKNSLNITNQIVKIYKGV